MSQKNNRIVVPEARDAMDKFKMEAANEVGVTLNDGYNGNLTSKQAGSVGGQMVKKMTPIRTSVFEREDRVAPGHKREVTYTYCIVM
ncbi:MAG: alpha/beta-type small acid-soluble spore protein [Clostridiales bacterium]|nr:alpha/beta-type small acid-soluble spore protein [Clostridiales bacterium]